MAIIPDHLGVEPITKVWPVRKVRQLPRNEIDISITGKASTAKDSYFVFELGAPLTLASHKAYQASSQFRSTIKLTTLERLEAAADFDDIERVYTTALA